MTATPPCDTCDGNRHISTRDGAVFRCPTCNPAPATPADWLHAAEDRARAVEELTRPANPVVWTAALIICAAILLRMFG